MLQGFEQIPCIIAEVWHEHRLFVRINKNEKKKKLLKKKKSYEKIAQKTRYFHPNLGKKKVIFNFFKTTL